MVEHTVTLINSGSWRTDMELEDGEVKTSDPYSQNTELVVEAKCSCGMEFETAEQAYEHIKEQEDV